MSYDPQFLVLPENVVQAEPNETIESAAARAVTMAYGKQETVMLRFSGFTVPVHPSLDKQVVSMYWHMVATQWTPEKKE